MNNLASIFNNVGKNESLDFWEVVTSWKMLERNCSIWWKNARKITEKRKANEDEEKLEFSRIIDKITGKNDRSLILC